MYLDGMGVKRSEEKGYKLLKKASSKGSIYAKGNMVKYYYHRKLFTKAAELATELVKQFSVYLADYILLRIIYACNYVIIIVNGMIIVITTITFGTYLPLGFLNVAS